MSGDEGRYPDDPAREWVEPDARRVVFDLRIHTQVPASLTEDEVTALGERLAHRAFLRLDDVNYAAVVDWNYEDDQPVDTEFTEQLRLNLRSPTGRLNRDVPTAANWNVPRAETRPAEPPFGSLEWHAAIRREFEARVPNADWATPRPEPAQDNQVVPPSGGWADDQGDGGEVCRRETDGSERVGGVCPGCGHTSFAHPGRFTNPGLRACAVCELRAEVVAARRVPGRAGAGEGVSGGVGAGGGGEVNVEVVDSRADMRIARGPR